MNENTQKASRKKFLMWSAALLGSASVAKVASTKTNTEEKPEDNETVKMLTQDGTLVEINTKLITQCGGKITNAELQQWIKK